MSSFISSVRDFSHFLWSGSFDPAFEQKLDALADRADVKDLIETKFMRDDYKFGDIKQIESVIKNNIQKNLTVNKITGNSQGFHTCDIHDQVSLSCPNLEYYRSTYGRFFIIGGIGSILSIVAIIANVAFAVIKNRSIAAFPLRNVALFGIVLGVSGRCAYRAISLFNSIEYINVGKFEEHAKQVKLKREKLYNADEKVRQKSYELSRISDEKAASSTEREIIQLLCMHKKSKLTQSANDSRCGFGRERNMTLSEVLGDYDVTKPVLTPELQAITAYLKEISDSDWIHTTTAALKDIILKGNWASNISCARELEEIGSEFSTMDCLKKLPPENQKTIIEHLKTYLDARLERKEAVLPTKGELADLIKPTKESGRKAMFEIIDKYKIPLSEISKEDPFWAQAGLKPDFTWADQASN